MLSLISDLFSWWWYTEQKLKVSNKTAKGSLRPVHISVMTLALIRTESLCFLFCCSCFLIHLHEFYENDNCSIKGKDECYESLKALSHRVNYICRFCHLDKKNPWNSLIIKMLAKWESNILIGKMNLWINMSGVWWIIKDSYNFLCKLLISVYYCTDRFRAEGQSTKPRYLVHLYYDIMIRKSEIVISLALYC